MVRERERDRDREPEREERRDLPDFIERRERARERKESLLPEIALSALAMRDLALLMTSVTLLIRDAMVEAEEWETAERVGESLVFLERSAPFRESREPGGAELERAPWEALERRELERERLLDLIEES